MRITARVLAFLALATTPMLSATSAMAGTPRPKPVTVAVSSSCANYRWVVSVTVTSTSARSVDSYDNSDQYNNRRVVAGAALTANKPYTFTVAPGGSAQKEELGIFAAGSGGWDGSQNPLASAVVLDPIQSNPYAGC